MGLITLIAVGLGLLAAGFLLFLIRTMIYKKDLKNKKCDEASEDSQKQNKAYYSNMVFAIDEQSSSASNNNKNNNTVAPSHNMIITSPANPIIV